MQGAEKRRVLEGVSWVLAALALWLVVHTGLVLALFSGLLVTSLVQQATPYLARRIHARWARLLAVGGLVTVVVLALGAVVWGGVVFFRGDAGNVHALLQRLADILEASRTQIPVWLAAYLPADVNALQQVLTQWLRDHATEARVLLPEAGHHLVHLLLGTVIGALIAVHEATASAPPRALAAALLRRMACFAEMFRKVVFAQVRISLINTLATGIYLLVVLPACGVHLPLLKTMIVVTFLAGLIPVLGNLLSNTLIVIVGLSHSLGVAAGALLYMVLIHKVEYFLNARIIGAQIRASAWELLIAILLMETWFGLPGLVVAPVYYAYLKKELADARLI